MSATTKTAVFVHGAWMIPASWDGFKSRFEAAGYTVYTPTWPHMDKPVAEQRSNPHPRFGSMGLKEIVDHHEQMIRALPEAPLLVGHSFGGLIVQMLLDRGVGAEGVAIDPGPIAGVIPGPVSLAAALPVVLRLNGWNTPFMLSWDAFTGTFANTAPAALQRSAYDTLVVPTPGRIFYEAALMLGTSVHAKERKQPLLIVVGEKDRTVTPYLARAAYNIQRQAKAPTDFHEFPGVSHFLCVEPGWEQVADYCLDWAKAYQT
jgi:pimeloyl-ACP methyl ester carboxylesterase